MKKSFGEWLDESWSTPLEADWPTKYEGLNRLLNGGYRKQHLTVIAGRPSMGKTTLMVDQAVDFAARRHLRVGMCSVERPASEIITKACTNYSGGDPRPDHLQAELSGLDLWVDDSGAGLTPTRIRSFVEEDPVDILFIDYLQLLGHEAGGGNENLKLTAILEDLQSLTKEHSLQTVLLCQLNRGVEYRRQQDPMARPVEADLRGSGSIEQIADEIIFIHREDQYREFKQNDGITELIVAKNRLGPTGTVRLTFIPEEETFV